MPMRALFLLLSVSLSLAACSWTRGARVQAGVSDPHFVFTNGTSMGFDSGPEAVCLLALMVQKGGEPVWEIVSDKPSEQDCVLLDGVSFGNVPEGFSQRVPPRPLVQNTVYRLSYRSSGDYPNDGYHYFCLGNNWQAEDVAYNSRGAYCRELR